MATKYAGVDLSYCQTGVDYAKLKSGAIKGYPIKFAMLRLGYGTSKDTMFDTHYKGCKAAGIYVGVYQWSRATNLTQARAEAKWAVEQLKNYKIDYPIAMDFEDAKVLAKGLTKAQYTAICKAYLSTLKQNNYYPMLYTGKYIIQDYLNLDDLKEFDLWLAQYTSEGYQAQLGQTMWQFNVAGHPSWDYAKVGSVSGVPGQCDCDWSYIGYAAKIKKLNMNIPIKKFKITATKTVSESEKQSTIDPLKKSGFAVSEQQV